MPSKKEILIFDSPFNLTNQLVKYWLNCAQNAIDTRGRFVVALSGGKSPIEFFCRLSGISDFDLWKNTYLFIVDERGVSTDHADSNFRSIKENLIDCVDIPAHNIFPVLVDPTDISASAVKYEEKIRDFFKLKEEEFPQFDLILLGLGDDGHTASLFPGDQINLKEQKRLAVAVSLPEIKNSRVSLTFPVINHAREVVFIILGMGKADVVYDLLEDFVNIPAAKVNPPQGNLTYFLDKAAAKRILFQNTRFTHKDDGISIIK